MIGSLLQPWHLILLIAVMVFFFGGKWFSNLGKGFAMAVRRFRDSARSSKSL
jgi:Sec-independent protein translocase protein TatA